MLKLLISFEEEKFFKKSKNIFQIFFTKNFRPPKKKLIKKNHKTNIMGFYELGDFG